MKSSTKVYGFLQNLSPLHFCISVTTCSSRLLSALTWAHQSCPPGPSLPLVHFPVSHQGDLSKVQILPGPCLTSTRGKASHCQQWKWQAQVCQAASSLMPHVIPFPVLYLMSQSLPACWFPQFHLTFLQPCFPCLPTVGSSSSAEAHLGQNLWENSPLTLVPTLCVPS